MPSSFFAVLRPQMLDKGTINDPADCGKFGGVPARS